jgi:hypothetical protein
MRKECVRSVNGADLGSDTLKVESLVYLLNFSTSHQAAAQSHTIYLEYHCVRPLVRIGLGLPHPLSRKRVCPHPQTKGEGVGGHTRLRVRGWGSPIRTTGEKA